MAGVRSNVGANGSYQFAVPSLLRLSKWCKQFAVNRSNVLANGCYQFAVSSPPVVANGSPQFTAIGSKVLANEAQDYEQRACYIKAFGLDSEKLTFKRLWHLSPRCRLFASCLFFALQGKLANGCYQDSAVRSNVLVNGCHQFAVRSLPDPCKWENQVAFIHSNVLISNW